MRDLLFLTDRYPYNNSEAFIENEIDIMASKFDRVFVLPCGLMVNTTTRRKVPENVIVLEPPCSDDIFQSKPSTKKKFFWAAKNLIPWFVSCLFCRSFYTELSCLKKRVGYSRDRLLKIFRTLAPAIRNRHYYKKALAKFSISDAYVYSYWIEPTILFSKQMLPGATIHKKICRGHGWDVFSERSPENYLAFQQAIFENIDFQYCISQNGYDYLCQKYPKLKDKFRISRLGTKDYGLPVKGRAPLSFTIVSCSSILALKRVDRIVDALALLQDKQSECRIIWYHFGAGQQKTEVIEHAKEKLIKMEYKFMGEISNQELMHFYKENHIDLFVNVSVAEGVPVSIMEAISFGIPVVATNVGGTSEIVHHNENGLLVNRDFSDRDLQVAINDFYKANVETEQFRMNSRKIWEEVCNYKVNYERFYTDFLGK